jgi:hypothetical protein
LQDDREVKVAIVLKKETALKKRQEVIDVIKGIMKNQKRGNIFIRMFSFNQVMAMIYKKL